MLKFAFALALVLLTGCQAPMAPAAPAAAPLAQPRVVPTAQLRHVLDVTGGASLFGINYSVSHSGSYTHKYGAHDTWNVNMPFSGRGTLVKASRDRAVYEVPADQVLILNQVSGDGSIALNGYAFSASTAAVSYVFGPGELVVFTFAPRQLRTTGDASSWTEYFGSLNVSGYTTSPSLLGQLGPLAK